MDLRIAWQIRCVHGERDMRVWRNADHGLARFLKGLLLHPAKPTARLKDSH
jgi:hypothetical protein